MTTQTKTIPPSAANAAFIARAVEAKAGDNSKDAITKAVSVITKGAGAMEGGTAALAFALAEIVTKPMTAKYVEGTGKKAVKHHVTFCLATYANAVKDRKARSAALGAICRGVLGVNDGPKLGAVKMAFTRALPLAVLMAANSDHGYSIKGGALSGVSVFDALDLGSGSEAGDKRQKAVVAKLEVNAAISNQKLTEKQMIQKMHAIKVTCDGSTHPVFGSLPTTTRVMALLRDKAVALGLVSEPEKREGDKVKAADVSGFVQALDILNSSVSRINETDEADFALTEEHEIKMRALYNAIAVYFEIPTD